MKCLVWFFFIFSCVLLLIDGVCSNDVQEQAYSPLYNQKSEYVDPNSMYYNRQSQKIRISNTYDEDGVNINAIEIRNQQTYRYSQCEDDSYEVFSRRLINIIIQKANFKVDDDMKLGKIDLRLDMDQFQILKGFGEGKVSFRELDGIINDIIQMPEINLFDEAVSYIDRLSFYLYEHRIIVGSILVSILVIIMALKVKWTRWRIIILLFDVFVIVSFMLTWWELLQESEIKLAAQRTVYMKIPNECKQNDITFVESLALFFGWGVGDCLKYYEAVMTDPALKVTPLQAFMHMVNKAFFYPLPMFGKYSSEFIENITAILPYWFQPVAKTLLVLTMPILFFVIIFILIGGAFGIKVGPLFHFYIHGRNSTPPSLDQPARQAIEIIRETVQETQAVCASTPQSSNVSKKEGSPEMLEKATQVVQIEDKKSKEEEEEEEEEEGESSPPKDSSNNLKLDPECNP